MTPAEELVARLADFEREPDALGAWVMLRSAVGRAVAALERAPEPEGRIRDNNFELTGVHEALRKETARAEQAEARAADDRAIAERVRAECVKYGLEGAGTDPLMPSNPAEALLRHIDGSRAAVGSMQRAHIELLQGKLRQAEARAEGLEEALRELVRRAADFRREAYGEDSIAVGADITLRSALYGAQAALSRGRAVSAQEPDQ